MPAGVIVIDRKKYAVGLFWQPLPAGQNPHDFSRQLTKQIAGRVKFYTESRSIVGVGARSMGHRRGMKVAAIEAVNSFSEYNSFLAEFFTPQGFWIVAVRNNIIIFDQLFVSESDAKREFMNLSALPDWGIIVASGSWNIPRAVEKSLRDVISGNSKQALIPVDSVFGNIFSLLIFGLVAMGMWYLFHEPIIKAFSPRPQQAKINPEILAEYKRQLEIKNAEIKKAAQPVKIKMPYENLPDVIQRADQCWRAIAFVMQPIQGWAQQNAECGNGFVRARFSRTYGNLSGLYDLIHEIMGGAKIIENTDSDVTVSMDLDQLPLITNNPPEKSAQELIFSINSIFQKMGQIVNIRPGVETVGTGAETVSTNIVTIIAASKLKPDEFIRIFNGISPMGFSFVKWDVRSRIWNYEVKIYAK